MKDSTEITYAPDFEIPGVDAEVHHLSRYLDQQKAVAVIFICNHCPAVNKYIDRLKNIQSQFAKDGFTLIAINSNDASKQPEDSLENMKAFAQKYELNFPYLWDSSQDVAHAFKAKTTPEAFLIDKEATVRYQGAIDDNPEAAEAVNTPYLEEAIDNLLRDREIPRQKTAPVGSSIIWRG